MVQADGFQNRTSKSSTVCMSVAEWVVNKWVDIERIPAYGGLTGMNWFFVIVAVANMAD